MPGNLKRSRAPVRFTRNEALIGENATLLKWDGG